MLTSEKYKFLTISQQKIMVQMYDNGNKLIFKEQDVYKNNRSFKYAMRQLANAQILSIENKKINGKYFNQYKLTFVGKMVVEDVIKEFIKSNL